MKNILLIFFSVISAITFDRSITFFKLNFNLFENPPKLPNLTYFISFLKTYFDTTESNKQDSVSVDKNHVIKEISVNTSSEQDISSSAYSSIFSLISDFFHFIISPFKFSYSTSAIFVSLVILLSGSIYLNVIQYRKMKHQ